ncbi:MerR family transcriptional regulator [Flavobacteriaceae bacterium]|jgi:DNA-binding transcriptional MerR regulator|nr:MerR family transcriptional regulator [Flavobacteriaceae bacterium]|tara:strand:- start:109 stop:426 length:318 start_codon:yes stop_codon:yes gene_type:complete
MHVDLPEKLYYSIGEISEAFNVNASLIRFWEKEFEILKPKKNSKGTRRYSSIDIEKLQTIHHLVKEKGYTLDGAKEQLKILNKNFEVIKKLEKVKSNLINIRNEL